jgi:Lon protease-like protein
MGVFQLLARGMERFTIRSSRVASNGLVRAVVDNWLEAEELPVEPDQISVEVLKAILERVGTGHIQGELRWSDAAWVGFRLAEILPVDMSERQSLLELRDARERLRQIHLILARHGLVS